MEGDRGGVEVRDGPVPYVSGSVSAKSHVM